MNLDLDSFEKRHNHHSFTGICNNCGHAGQIHYGYSSEHVICWDELGQCICSKFEEQETK